MGGKSSFYSKGKGGFVTSKVRILGLAEGLRRKKEEIIARIVRDLTYIGETCVKVAREPHPNDWGDVTGNLRSSIGYGVFVDGEQVSGSVFDAVKATATEGSAEGKALLQKVAATYPKGVTLIVCAGMNYAVYVEAKGRDVLTTAELEAERLLKRLLSGIANEK